MLRVTVPRLRAAACAAVAAVVLVSCGQQDDGGSAEDDPAPSSSSPAASADESAPPGTPECSDVWQRGARIPRAYRGCTDESGAYVERDVLACSSGQRMVRYADRYWGVLGGTVNEASGSLDDDRDYETSMRNCSA